MILIVQDMFPALMIQVVKTRRNHAALVRKVSRGQDFRDVQIDVEAGFVMNHRSVISGAGEGRTSGEEGGESEEEKFHGIVSLFKWAACCLAVSSQ